MTTSLSAVPLPERCVVVFDLDDTLYPERDFVCSGFRAVAELVARTTSDNHYQRLIDWFDAKQADPFGRLLAECDIPIDKAVLVHTYRVHYPDLKLSEETTQLLNDLSAAGNALGILTDGRSIAQRNKIRALGLDHWTDAVVISEEIGSSKPAVRNYQYFEQRFLGRPHVYVGDNPAKDFIAPNRLGWQTVGLLDAGRHIHSQDLANISEEALPQYWTERLA